MGSSHRKDVPEMKKRALSIFAAAAAVAASAIYYYFFTTWTPVVYVLSVALYALAAGLLTARFAEKKPLLRGAIAGGVFSAVFFALTFLINNLIFKAGKAMVAGAIMSGLALVFFIVYYCVLSRRKQKNSPLAALAFVLSIVATLGSMFPSQMQAYYRIFTDFRVNGQRELTRNGLV